MLNLSCHTNRERTPEAERGSENVMMMRAEKRSTTQTTTATSKSQQQVVAGRSRSRASMRLKSSHKLPLQLLHGLLIAAISECLLVQAYEFTIAGSHERPPLDGAARALTGALSLAAGPPYFQANPIELRLDQAGGPGELLESSRLTLPAVSGASGVQVESNEDQELRQLHQVVNTMAHLLNQEEEEEAVAAAAKQQASSSRESDPIRPEASEQQAVVMAAPAVSGLDDEQQQQQQQQQHSSRQRREQQTTGHHQLDDGLVPAEAEQMSESAIRQAIAQLEQVQAEERQRQQRADVASAAASGQFASDQIAASQQQQRRRDAALESLIDELDEQMLDDQVAAASQEPERLLSSANERKPNGGTTQSGSNSVQEVLKSDASIVSASNANRQKTSGSQSDASQPTSEIVVSNSGDDLNIKPAASSESSPLLVGQLNSAGSVDSLDTLGSALTSDFYSFHAGSIGANTAVTSVTNGSGRSNLNETPSSGADARGHQQSASNRQPNSSGSSNAIKNDGKIDKEENLSLVSGPREDLDSAAQTRNSQRQELPSGQPFDQGQTSSLDFSQPQFRPQQLVAASSNSQLQPNGPFGPQSQSLPPSQQQQQQQQSQQQQFPGGSQLIQPQDNFWHPSSVTGGSGSQQQQPSPFNFNQEPGVSLPPPRFQNLASPAPFLQTISSQRGQAARSAPQPQHFHFTGHGLVEADPFQTPSPPSGTSAQQEQGRERFVSTSSPPMISVISGSEPVGTNSVSWNPPAAIQSTSSPFGSTFQPTFAPTGSPQHQQFRNAFTSASQHERGEQPTGFVSSFRPNQNQAEGNFFVSQPPPSVRTEAPLEFLPPSSTPVSAGGRQFWPGSSPGPPTGESATSSGEREAADSRPRTSTVRTFLKDEPADRPADNSPEQDLNLEAGPPARPVSSPRPFATFQPSTEIPLVFSSVGAPTSTQAAVTGQNTPRAITNQRLNSQNAPVTALPPSSTPPTTSTTTTATSSVASLAPANATAGPKKDDTVIYYYYYYDDNNNATVVAKNVSASAAANLNGATLGSDPSLPDGDSGLEDTPYMEDAILPPPPPPPPQAVKPVASFQPIGRQSQNVQPVRNTTNTAAATAIAVETNMVRPRQQQPQDFATSEQPKEFRAGPLETSVEPELGLNDYEPAQNDQQRPPVSPTRHQFEASTRPTGANTSAPSRMRQPESALKPAPLPPQRISSTLVSSTAEPPPLVADPRQGPAPNSRGPPKAGDRRQETPTGRGNQNQASNNSGRGQVAPGQSSSRPIPSTATLSNASRYGTSTSNQFLDPYGLEPAAGQPPIPVPTPHHSHTPERHAQHNNHKQIEAPSASKPERTSHQIEATRRPSSTDSVLLASAGSWPTSSNQPDSTRFSPQRNQQHHQQAPSAAVQLAARPQQQPPVQTEAQPRARQQFYPESGSAGQPASERPPANKPQMFASRLPVSSKPVGTSNQQRTTPSTGATSVATSAVTPQADVEPATIDKTTPAALNKLDTLRSSVEDSQRISGSTSSPSNGRPTSSEGNTGNGFTRAPPVDRVVGGGGQQRSSTEVPDDGDPERQNHQAAADDGQNSKPSFGQHVSVSASMGPATVSSVSVSRIMSSATPGQTAPTPTMSTSRQQQQTPATMNMISSPAASPAVSNETPVATSSTTPSSTTTSTSTTTTTSATSVSSATQTQAPNSQEAASQPASTESSDSQAASTRRKYGNRTNRFQTRLSAIQTGSSAASARPAANPSGSTTTTTTTTTTRRPTVSTTRKSSKQLFAGRRRLGSSTSSTTSVGGESESSSVPSAVPNESSPSGSPPSSKPASQTSSSSPSSIAASRARFGNNFPLRSRAFSSSTTTTTSAPQSNQQESTGDSSRPASSLFAQPRPGTFKPRLSLLKSTTSRPSTTSTETSSSSSSVTAPSGDQNQAASTGSGNQDSSGSETTNGVGAQTMPAGDEPSPSATSASGQNKAESEANQPASSTIAVMPTSSSTLSPTSTTPSATSSSAKPKRPLFASRQRSGALFGNRRSNEQTAPSNS